MGSIMSKDQSAAQVSQLDTRIQLTPVENALKTLLLDVARHIHENKIVAGGSDVTERPRTVLRFTGGWVRDKLLGVESHDIDVAISSMTGSQFGKALKEYYDVPANSKKYLSMFPNDQLKDTVVRLHKIEANPEKSKHLETSSTKLFGLEIDLVNLRKETYTEDSRNPQMEFGTAEEDALRRDATINTLFYNLTESKLEDLTGRGLQDIKNKLIRTPMEPYQTFKDDPLRVLRLIRFASRLGYRIDEETEEAMQNPEISEVLKIKISKERVERELEKMLRGPDPRRALHLIDRLGLYPTIFANHQDDVDVDTSTWWRAYDTLHRFFRPPEADGAELLNCIARVRKLLIRDATEEYYAWIIAAFAPWSFVPDRPPTGPKFRPQPPRPAEIARDSLRAENKTITILRDAATAARDVIDTKTSLVQGTLPGTAAEIRQVIGLRIRAWNKDWRLCILLAMLQEVMEGREVSSVIREYDQFVSYIVDQGLTEVTDLKPIVNGREISKFLEAPMGPWMSRALDMVIKWQLLHPEITDKEHALQDLASKKDELQINM